MGVYVSLHGRAIGYDAESGAIQRPGLDSFDNEDGVTAASTAANIKWRGTTTMNTTAAKDYTLNAITPATVGMYKQLCSITTSTAIKTVSLTNATFVTTIASSVHKASFTFQNQALSLVAVSTALVQILANNGTVTLST
jgi:hypothetical protein